MAAGGAARRAEAQPQRSLAPLNVSIGAVSAWCPDSHNQIPARREQL